MRVLAFLALFVGAALATPIAASHDAVARQAADWKRQGADWKRQGADWKRQEADWKRQGADWKRQEDADW